MQFLIHNDAYIVTTNSKSTYIDDNLLRKLQNLLLEHVANIAIAKAALHNRTCDADGRKRDLPAPRLARGEIGAAQLHELPLQIHSGATIEKKKMVSSLLFAS
jgi:hypothetical protein